MRWADIGEQVEVPGLEGGRRPCIQALPEDVVLDRVVREAETGGYTDAHEIFKALNKAARNKV